MKKKLAQFIEITFTSWDDIHSVGQALTGGYVFRGMEDSKWTLKTSIERAAEQLRCPPNQIWSREKEVLQRFKARAHHFIQSPPSDENNIEWLSLIQHHGGPTRLLDFTESFYVAAYFAVQNARREAAIWAISRARLHKSYLDLQLTNYTQEKDSSLHELNVIKFAETFIMQEKNTSRLLTFLPPRLNERQAVQKGVFIFPCDIENSFVSNFGGYFSLPSSYLKSKNALQIKPSNIPRSEIEGIPIWKLNLPRNLHSKIISELHSMNIDAASLFPGLDGFAKSLYYFVRKAPSHLVAGPMSVTISKSGKKIARLG